MNQPDPKYQTALSFAAQLVEGTKDGISAFDKDLNYILWSPTMERIFGLSASEVLGQNVFSVFPAFSQDEEGRYFRETLTGKSAHLSNQCFTLPNSEENISYDVYYSPLQLGSSQILGGIVIVRDITQIKKAEQELKETETRFKKMADHSPVLLWMSGTDSLCNFFNQTWLDFTGRTMEQELGVGWSEGLHPEDFQRSMDIYIAAFKKKEPFEMEYRLLRYDDRYRWILDRGTPRYSPNGEFAGYIGSCIDITERKVAETDLKKAVMIRDEFLIIASHELKTPLTSLKLQIQLLNHIAKSGTISLENVKKVSLVCEKQVAKLTELVEDLLDVSRITSGRLSLNPQPVDLCESIEQVLERLSKQIADSEYQITVQKPESLVGAWDKTRLDQVIVNLLTNALKYGSNKPITIFVQKNGDRAQLRVKDHGIGIPQDQLSKVFDRFVRAVSSENYGGLGLGLYIVKEIVTAHNGTIHVESTLGIGSEFIVELPIK